jgi:hypothetical protein
MAIDNIENMWEVDEKVLYLYREGMDCVSMAGRYYPEDDTDEWRPMFDRLLQVLWSVHLFLEYNLSYWNASSRTPDLRAVILHTSRRQLAIFAGG